ncbi:MAG: hypothetical protein H0V82_10625 [Candidatus Protochlamydia sp.]|nr:hypothetical protein [Candidatus Protochlamydia sp.]
MTPHSLFLKSFCLTVLVLAPLIILINGIMDPYGILGSFQADWLNRQKPQAEHHQRLVQAIEISKIKPKVLFMGSSRTRAAMRPENLQPYTDEKVFNLGLSAVTVEEIYAYLEHAIFHQPEIKEVIIDLDLFMFNRNRKLNIEFDPNRLKKTGIILDDYVGSLFTFSTLTNSFLTFKHNFIQYLFPKKIHLNESRLFPTPKDWNFIKDIAIAHAWFGKYEIDPKQVAFYANIAKVCHEKKIALKIYFSPAQDIYWETIFQKKLWPIFEDLKRDLCHIHPFFDFSGYNLVTARKCEQPGEPLYTDCSHYTPLVGQWILAKLYHDQHLNNVPAFGHWMTSDKIEENLEQMRGEREEWAKIHRPLIESISQIIK